MCVYVCVCVRVCVCAWMFCFLFNTDNKSEDYPVHIS